MNKAELIDAIASSTEQAKTEVIKTLESFMEIVAKELKEKDGKVSLVGFGTFSSKERGARMGRNPKTGKSLKIAAKIVAKWKPAKDLL